MAVKPLNAGQKKVLASFARAVVYAEMESNIAGFKGYQQHMRKMDPESAQAEREFQKAVKQFRAGLKAEMESQDGP